MMDDDEWGINGTASSLYLKWGLWLVNVPKNIPEEI